MLLSEYFFNSQTALKNYAYFIFIPCPEDENQALYNFSTDFVPNSLLHVFLTSFFFQEILSGDTLLNSFTPLLVAVCSNPVKYADPDLRCSAGLALAKFMLMSSDFADKHLRSGGSSTSRPTC